MPAANRGVDTIGATGDGQVRHREIQHRCTIHIRSRAIQIIYNGITRHPEEVYLHTGWIIVAGCNRGLNIWRERGRRDRDSRWSRGKHAKISSHYGSGWSRPNHGADRVSTQRRSGRPAKPATETAATDRAILRIRHDGTARVCRCLIAKCHRCAIGCYPA